MIFTREELHRRVWAKPMADAAHDLDLTAGELERLCRSLDVPFPYSGFWRDGAPLDARARKLPQARPGRPETVILDGPVSRPSRPPPGPKPAAAGHPGSIPSPAQPPGSDTGVALVPNDDLHPIIAARQEARRRKAEDGLHPPTSTALAATQPLDRYDLIRSRLFLALERAGHVVTTDGASLYEVRFEVEGQTVSHWIRERYTRTKRPLTVEEARDPGNVVRGRPYVFEERMTGQLILAIQTRSYGRKSEWRDHPRRGRLEDRIDEIVAGIEAAVRDAHRIDAERQEADARRRRREIRRAEAERRAQEEAWRWERLCELSAWHEEARGVAGFLERLRRSATAQSEDRIAAAWFDHFEAEARQRDPLTWTFAAVMRHVNGPSHPDYDDDEGFGDDDDDERDCPNEDEASRDPD